MISSCCTRHSVTTSTESGRRRTNSRERGVAEPQPKQQIISQAKDPVGNQNLNSHSNGIYRRIVALWYRDKDNVETYDAEWIIFTSRDGVIDWELSKEGIGIVSICMPFDEKCVNYHRYSQRCCIANISISLSGELLMEYFEAVRPNWIYTSQRLPDLFLTWSEKWLHVILPQEGPRNCGVRITFILVEFITKILIDSTTVFGKLSLISQYVNMRSLTLYHT